MEVGGIRWLYHVCSTLYQRIYFIFVVCITLYTIHYTLYIIHYTLCIFNDDSRCKHSHTPNVKCYEVIYVNILVSETSPAKEATQVSSSRLMASVRNIILVLQYSGISMWL